MEVVVVFNEQTPVELERVVVDLSILENVGSENWVYLIVLLLELIGNPAFLCHFSHHNFPVPVNRIF